MSPSLATITMDWWEPPLVLTIYLASRISFRKYEKWRNQRAWERATQVVWDQAAGEWVAPDEG